MLNPLGELTDYLKVRSSQNLAQREGISRLSEECELLGIVLELLAELL